MVAELYEEEVYGQELVRWRFARTVEAFFLLWEACKSATSRHDIAFGSKEAANWPLND